MRYLTKIEKLRYVEYGWLAKTLCMGALSTFLLWLTPIVVSIITFTTCVLLGLPLTAGRILSALATIRVLQAPLSYFPEFFQKVIQAKVSLARLRLYLQEPELATASVVRIVNENGTDSDMAIQIEGGKFSWEPDGEAQSLDVVNLQVRKGLRVAICGSVGSGKSSILSCMLGEMPKLSGTVSSRISDSITNSTFDETKLFMSNCSPSLGCACSNFSMSWQKALFLMILVLLKGHGLVKLRISSALVFEIHCR